MENRASLARLPDGSEENRRLGRVPALQQRLGGKHGEGRDSGAGRDSEEVMAAIGWHGRQRQHIEGDGDDGDSAEPPQCAHRQ